MKSLRLIPMTMATAAVLMAIKTVDVIRGTDALSSALAQQQQPGDPASNVNVPKDAAAKPADAAAPGANSAAAPADDKPLDAASFAAAINKDNPDNAKKDAAPATDAPKKDAPADKKDTAPAADKKAATPAADKKLDAKAEDGKEEKKDPAVSDTPGEVTDRHFSKVELDLLQNLSSRRAELDRWESNIEIKEATLDATEKRIDDKIQQIDAMKQAVAALLDQYNEKEDAKIRSLVKIYENMKPKDAATIFNELEMPVLLLIVDKMSEKKSAPVLAEMNPLKAKQITVELAQQRHLNSGKLNAAAAAATPSATPPTSTAQK